VRPRIKFAALMSVGALVVVAPWVVVAAIWGGDGALVLLGVSVYLVLVAIGGLTREPWQKAAPFKISERGDEYD
jgi:hypothetical protein